MLGRKMAGPSGAAGTRGGPPQPLRPAFGAAREQGRGTRQRHAAGRTPAARLGSGDVSPPAAAAGMQAGAQGALAQGGSEAAVWSQRAARWLHGVGDVAQCPCASVSHL